MRPLAAFAALTLMLVLLFGALAQPQTFTRLYSFTGGSDGAYPNAVIRDSAGNLYGTTWEAGDVNSYCPYGCGVVYRFDTAGTESVLHSFSGWDGQYPAAPMIRDRAGNLYGTTTVGGSAGYGAVFKIDKAGNETLLYSFTGSKDGCFPWQGLIRDKAGNLYGTSAYCGLYGHGTLFKLGTTKKFTVLHSFTGGSSGGGYPEYGHLTMDNCGNLYGVASCINGHCLHGVLYMLNKKGRFTVLHNFAGGTADGCEPFGTVTLDKAGNLYGTTIGCGPKGYGTIWKVNKKREETILHDFANSRSDGCYPVAGVTRDAEGTLYGTTEYCGADNWGTLYKLSAKGTFSLLHSFSGSDGNIPVDEVVLSCKGALFGSATGGGAYDYGTLWSYVP